MGELSTSEHSGELIIGLVGPVGTDLAKVAQALQSALDQRDYEWIAYRLSEWFESGSPFTSVAADTEYSRIKSAMDAGDWIRGQSKRADIMAIQSATRIAAAREKRGEGTTTRCAHILRSLKRPEEAEYLRWLYGSRFLLISAYVPRRRRLAYLAKKMTELQAMELVGRDEDAETKFGQATNKTFQVADLFVNADLSTRFLVDEIGRFLDLVLGSPLVTPGQHEHAMFLAYASSLRSGDLSRQVGAVIVTDDGTMIAEGANDAPRYGGGRHWPGPGDSRDIALGYDANTKIIRQMVDNILRAVGNHGAEWSEHDRERVAALLAPSGVLDITEFGRAVHAEMDALMSCTRIGVSARGKVMYCTTFPCHNCAKHLLAAGLRQIWFIEPYPKSRALELHPDAISDGDDHEKMQLTAFVGVGPRRYIEWFALSDQHGVRLRRKDSRGDIIAWSAKRAWPRSRDRQVSHLDLEAKAAAEVEVIIEALEPLQSVASASSRPKSG